MKMDECYLKPPKTIDNNSGIRAIPGSLVICITDRLKNYTKDKEYLVDKIQTKSHRYGAHKLKVEGISGFVLATNFSIKQ